MEKKTLKILLAGLLFIIITGCSESAPTGEMVYEKPAAESLCWEYVLLSVNLFANS